MEKNITPTVSSPVPQPDDPALKLAAFNAAILKRFAQVSDYFTLKDLDPTQSPSFKKFITEHLALTNSHYVITGKFKDYSVPDDQQDPSAATTDKLKEQGFAVSGSKAALDSGFSGNRAAEAAIEEGAFDEEDEGEILGPEKKT